LLSLATFKNDKWQVLDPLAYLSNYKYNFYNKCDAKPGFSVVDPDSMGSVDPDSMGTRRAKVTH
jgi:hypothetical protein